MFFKRRSPTITFRCAVEDKGLIAEPVPAKTVLPDWFRKLPPVHKAHQSVSDNGLTIKRCMPFLDAMTTGWIIPLPASLRMEVKNSGTETSFGWEFDKVLVSSHHSYQIDGHPKGHLPPNKFHNYWTIETPPGWSCLFVQPLNRGPQLFEVLSGVVDTDTYASLIHFPFLATAPDGLHVIEKGTPLVQVIPFQRETTAIKADIRAETEADKASRKKILRQTQASVGWYRLHARAQRQTQS